jgi:hypothetical protein
VGGIPSGGENCDGVNCYLLSEVPISPALFGSIEELEQLSFSIRSSNAHIGGETSVYLDFVEITLQMVLGHSRYLLLAAVFPVS